MSENILIYDTIKRIQRYRYFTQLRNGKGIQTTLNSLGKKRDFHRHNNRNGTTSICDVCNSIREDIQYGSRAEAGVEEYYSYDADSEGEIVYPQTIKVKNSSADFLWFGLCAVVVVLEFHMKHACFSDNCVNKLCE